LTQYLAVKLVAMGLKAGPLSPVWCAVSLTFVPVTLYATAVFSEPLGAMRGLGVVAAMGCVVMASMGQDEAAGRAGLSSWRGRALYGALLVTILLANSVSDVAMKEMGTRTVSGVAGAASYVKQYGDLFVTLLYAFLAAGVVGDMVVRRKGREPGMATGRLKVALGLGVVAAVGSIGGIWLTQQFAGSHAAMAFTVRGAASILAASVVSVIAFRERFSRRWVGTVGLGVLAVVMAAPWGQSQSTRPERPADVQNQAMSSNVNKATVSAGQ
jgi:drug/metabolite transporter (DMT)-like permease